MSTNESSTNEQIALSNGQNGNESNDIESSGFEQLQDLTSKRLLIDPRKRDSNKRNSCGYSISYGTQTSIGF